MANIESFSFDYTGRHESEEPPYQTGITSGSWGYTENGLEHFGVDGTLAFLANLPTNTINFTLVSTNSSSNSDVISYYFRQRDSENFFRFIWRSSDGIAVIDKHVKDQSKVRLSSNTGFGTGIGTVVNISIELTSTSIRVVINGQEAVPLITDSTFGDVDSTSELELGEKYAIQTASFDFDSDKALPQVLNGYASTFTKLGKIFDNHSANDNPREFWARAYLTKDYPEFNSVDHPNNSTKYPVILESSSDHASGSGGILLRVYEERGFYDLSDKDSWHEWQEISNRPEFDHIETKTGIIFKDPDDRQTETAKRLVREDGLIFMFYHCTDVFDPATGKTTQTTKYATSRNGVDFTPQGISGFNIDPDFLEGDGHDGYQDVGLNVFDEIPYKYISRGSQGGGGVESGPTFKVSVSNDLITWKRWKMLGRSTGFLQTGTRFNKIASVSEAKKEGPYYRVPVIEALLATGTQPNSASVGEALVDSDFNYVSYVNNFLTPTPGTFDENQTSDPSSVLYASKRWAFYRTRNASDNSEIGVGTMEDVPYLWRIMRPFSNKRHLIGLMTDGSPIDTGITYNSPTSFKQESGFDYTVLTLPANGDTATAITDDSFVIADNDFIDIIFENIGKDSAEDISLQFGFVDDLNNPIEGAYFDFRNRSGWTSDSWRSRPMQIRYFHSSEVKTTVNYYGLNDEWRNYGNQGDESPKAKHVVGFRILKDGTCYTIQGTGEDQFIALFGMDLSKAYRVFIRGNIVTTTGNDDSISFAGIRVVARDKAPIAVPDAPVLSVDSVSSNEIRLSCSSVEGATGYKFFAGIHQSEDGIFTGLIPEENYVVYARASNELGDSEPSNATFVTTAQDSIDTKPIAVVGNNFSVTAGETVQLDGSGSYDAETDITVYAWTLTVPEGSSASLSDRFAVNPTYTTDVAGEYITSLVVTDSTDNFSDPVEHRTTATAVPLVLPTVNAGDNVALTNGGSFSPNASASEYDSLLWTCPSGQNPTFSDNAVLTPSITVNETGVHTFRLTATNSDGQSYDEFIATVSELTNQPPVANAGPDQSVAAATQFTLDGTGSQDTDGTIIEYRWTQTAGDTVTLNLDDPARPTAKSPSKTTAQRLTFQLVTVDDEGAESSPGTVNIDVAAFAVSEMLKLLDTRQWTVVNDGSVQAFEGRSNREAFRFQVTPSDGIQTSAEGYFLFDQPGVHAVEVISTPTSKISSVDDPYMIRGDVIAARIGDLQTDENGNLTLTFVLYVTDDKDGLVMTAKVIEPYQKASYFRKQG